MPATSSDRPAGGFLADSAPRISSMHQAKVVRSGSSLRLNAAERDIDGHTDYDNYPTPPKSIFLDTGGDAVGGLVIDYVGPASGFFATSPQLALDTNGRSIASPFRVEWSGVPTWAGCVQVLDDPIHLRVPKFNLGANVILMLIETKCAIIGGSG